MSYPELTPLEAIHELDAYRVIDVREPYEFQGPLGHIECAESIPLGSVEENVHKLSHSLPLLFVCRSGKRSGIACERLQKSGVDDVSNLAGGMIAWNQAQLSVLHSEPTNLSALIDQIVSWVAQVGPQSRDAVQATVVDRLAAQSLSIDAPTHAAVEGIISFSADALAESAPADLEICLASFRRSLAVL